MLNETTADECNEATEELARYLDAGLLVLEELAEAHWSFMDGYAAAMIARGRR